MHTWKYRLHPDSTHISGGWRRLYERRVHEVFLQAAGNGTAFLIDYSGAMDNDPPASSSEYSEKYAVLAMLLEPERDYIWLRNHGCSEQLIAQFWKSNRSALRHYAQELQTDFRQLYAAALPKALASESFADELGELETALNDILRYIRYRLLLEFVAPPIGIWRKHLRRLTVVKSRFANVGVMKLLHLMESVRQGIDPTSYV